MVDSLLIVTPIAPIVGFFFLFSVLLCIALWFSSLATILMGKRELVALPCGAGCWSAGCDCGFRSTTVFNAILMESATVYTPQH